MHPFKLLLPIIVGVQAPTGAAQDVVRQDGNWWLSISQDYRLGFLWGFIDSSPTHVRKQIFSGRPPSVLHPMITKYLEEHPSDRQKPIELLLQNTEFMAPIKSEPGGETYSGRHGFLDGEYWRVSVRDERYGLIQGYITASKCFKTPKGKFSASVASYERRLSDWYGTKEEDDEALNQKRASVPIFEAFHRLKD